MIISNKKEKDLNEYLFLRKRKRQIVNIIFLLLAVFSIFVMLIYALKGVDKLYVIKLDNAAAFKFLLIPFVFAAVTVAVLVYAKIKNPSLYTNSIGDSKSLRIERRIDNLDKLISKSKNGTLLEKDKKILFGYIYQTLKKESIEKNIEEIKSQIVKNEKSIEINDFFESAINKLQKSADKTSTSSTVNLVIGIITSGLSIAILGYSVFSFNGLGNGNEYLLFSLISRVGVSLCIQLLSLFFLKLYKNNLNEIKYIQNEITNIEAKKIASIISLDFTEENRMEVIKNLVNTERNFILDKNQSTIQLEQNKLDNEDFKGHIQVMESLLNIRNK